MKGSVSQNTPTANGFGKKKKHPLTDIGNAQRLAKKHRGVLRYCEDWSKWIVFNGQRWEISVVRAREKAIQSALGFYNDAAEISDGMERRTLVEHAEKSQSIARVKAMLELSQSEPGILVKHNQLDIHPMLLNCTNGTVDLSSGKLLPHNREHLLTKLCLTKYKHNASCPRFAQFMLEIFDGNAELVKFMQRLLGYGICGEVSEHILPIFHGSGANGKSTLINTVWDVIGPDYAMKAPQSLLIASHNTTHPTEQADLFGMRLVACVETPENARLNETAVKEITGGDKIRARRMREDFWEFAPSHTAVLATNHKPNIRGTDQAIWRRVMLIPFDVSFQDKPDKALPEKLRMEHSGILRWLVEGCLEWQRIGLQPPPIVLAATKEYRSDEDVLGNFLQERCVIADAVQVKSSQLYAAYQEWTEAAGIREMSRTAFGKAISERGFEKKKSNGVWYLGLGLLSESSEF